MGKLQIIVTLHLLLMDKLGIINPVPFLYDFVGKPIIVRLKWGIQYKGFLVSTDNYMNIQLASTEEYVDGKFIGAVGEVFIRCNDILLIRKCPEDDDTDEQDKMKQ